jgi:hypothetical protein
LVLFYGGRSLEGDVCSPNVGMRTKSFARRGREKAVRRIMVVLLGRCWQRGGKGVM